MTISDRLHLYISLFLDNSGDAYKCWDHLTLKAGVRFVPHAHAVRFAARLPRALLDGSRKKHIVEATDPERKMQYPVTFGLCCHHL